MGMKSLRGQDLNLRPSGYELTKPQVFCGLKPFVAKLSPRIFFNAGVIKNLSHFLLEGYLVFQYEGIEDSSFCHVLEKPYIYLHDLHLGRYGTYFYIR